MKDEATLKSLYNDIKGKKAHFQEPDINDEWTAIAFFPTIEDLTITKKLPLALKEYKRPDLVLHQV